MSWKIGLIVTALTIDAIGTGCLITQTNLDYCSNVNGDAFCQQRHGDERGYCVFGSDACLVGLPAEQKGDPSFDGCVISEPEDECHSPCGGRQAQTELDGCRGAGETGDGDGSSSDSENVGTTSELSADGTGSSSDGITSSSDGTVEESMTGATSECGNGVLESMELCDVDVGDQTCMSLGFDGGALACTPDCLDFDTSGCIVCGDGIQEGSETCDWTELGEQTCETRGYDGGVLLCNADCSGFDESGCFGCGNGMLELGEICDTNDFGALSCGSLGFDTGTLECDSDCMGFDASECSDCGNGMLDPGEICDGAALNGLDCNSFGYASGTLNCQEDCFAYNTGSCSPYRGDCCNAGGGTPGCNEPNCAVAVCAIDPTCCNDNWGVGCAILADILPSCSCM